MNLILVYCNIANNDYQQDSRATSDSIGNKIANKLRKITAAQFRDSYK